MTYEELNKTDRFAAENGIRLQEDGCTATMQVSERHLNGANVCQGGALFTLADLAAAGLTQGKMLTVDSDIRFLHPALLGDILQAKATFIHEGRLPLIRTEIVNQDQRLLAVVTSRFYAKQ